MTKIEPKFDVKDEIILMLNRILMTGLCSKCYSSGVSVVLNEETFEAVCDKCRS